MDPYHTVTHPVAKQSACEGRTLPHGIARIAVLLVRRNGSSDERRAGLLAKAAQPMYTLGLAAPVLPRAKNEIWYQERPEGDQGS